jgi:hypothetical protein
MPLLAEGQAAISGLKEKAPKERTFEISRDRPLSKKGSYRNQRSGSNGAGIVGSVAAENSKDNLLPLGVSRVDVYF